jgi:hypothetical protein
MKLTVNDVKKLLAVHENYPSLWSIKVKDYVGTKRNETTFTNFNAALRTEGLLGDLTSRLKQKYTI